MMHRGEASMNTGKVRNPAHRSRGFTLIELLVVVAIIAILAAMATTAYRSQVTKATRAQAKACLTQYAQAMERMYTTRQTYDWTSYTGGAEPVLACASESNMAARYTIRVLIANVTASTYRATAVPTTAWSPRDTRCGTLTLNQTGARGAGSNTAADISYCW